MVAEEDLFSLQILTCLQTLRLKVASNCKWDATTLRPLQHLTALTRLGMIVHGLHPGPMLLAPEMSKLTLLTRLTLDHEWAYDEECTYDADGAGTIISNLTGLQRLSLTCIVDRIPEAFSKLQSLQSLSIGGQLEDWPNFSVQSSISACRASTYLKLQGFTAVAETEWLGACSAISGLPSLSKLCLTCVDFDEVASNEWALGSSLTSLLFIIGCVGKFPKALTRLTTLRELSLSRVNLDDMSEFPVGPYLEHITHLNLCQTILPQFPEEAFCQACNLKMMTANHDEPWLDVHRLQSILPQHCVLNILPASEREQ